MLNKALGSTPVESLNSGVDRFVKKGMPTIDPSTMSMHTGLLLGQNASNRQSSPSQNFGGMRMMSGGLLPMPGGFPMGMNSLPHQVPPLSYQLNSMNFQNQSQYSQSSSGVGPRSSQSDMMPPQMMNMQSQMKQSNVGSGVLGSMKSNTFSSAGEGRGEPHGSMIMPPGVPRPGMPGMSPMIPPSASFTPPKSSTPVFNPMNMIEMSRVFLSSMRDLTNKSKATGVLKFFNEGKGFGFFVNDADGKDVFFHFEDLKELKITKDFLREAKNKYIVKFAFTIQVYYGKYSYSSKAVDIDLLGLIDLRFLQKNESTITN